MTESQNNQVYRDARRIYKGGTPEFDLEVSSLIQFGLQTHCLKYKTDNHNILHLIQGMDRIRRLPTTSRSRPIRHWTHPSTKAGTISRTASQESGLFAGILHR